MSQLLREAIRLVRAAVNQHDLLPLFHERCDIGADGLQVDSGGAADFDDYFRLLIVIVDCRLLVAIADRKAW